MASPSPVPPTEGREVWFSWENRVNSRGWSSGAMPGPWSRTSTRRTGSAADQRARMATSPPPENFTALAIRFSSTCLIRSWSSCTTAPWGLSTSVERTRPFSAAGSANSSVTSRTRSGTDVG